MTVIGLFNDPIEVSKFSQFCDDDNSPTCADSVMDIDFPIDDDLIDTLLEVTAKELVIMFSAQKEDTSSDSRDSTLEESK